MHFLKFAILAAGLCAVGSLGWTLTSPLFVPKNPLSILSAVISERDIGLARGISYGQHPRRALDVYEPAKGEGRAVILFLYGGGWKSGERSTYGFVGAALASRGYTVVIPDYRHYPDVKFPAFMDDAAQAYVHAQKHIARGRPVFFMGHSAGAHMAALLALDERYLVAAGSDLPKPTGLIGLAGPYAFDPTTWPTTKEIFTEALSADAVRPVAHVSANAPPMLLMHGLKDEVVKLYNLRDMDAAARSVGVSSKAVELEDTGHIGILLAIARPFRWKGPVLKEILGFLEAQTDTR